MYSDKKNKERLDLGHRLHVGLGMVGFNQGLVQFADSKANGLVVVNSIFLASMVPALEGVRHAGPEWLRMMGGAFFACCVLALLASLMVMISRGAPAGEARGKSLLFHKHIIELGKAQSYVDEVREADGEKLLDSLLVSNFDLATIASAKFRAYKIAERLTLGAAVLWVAGMVAIQIV
jgi:hypothetical protein